MNVLVVGGAGYVGSCVTDLLMEAEHDVRVYDALLYEESYRKPVDFVYGDVRDRQDLLPHLKWADAVVWLAALVGDGACALNGDITIDINQESVKWLADNYDGRIIFLSTCSVYGAQDAVLDELSPTNPLSLYAATKFAAEAYLQHKDAVIFRLGTLFGSGDLFSRVRLDLVVNYLTVRAYRVGKITIFGGDQYRPLLHVRDAARAIVHTLDVNDTGIFNLHKENLRIIDLAYRIKDHFPNLLIERTSKQFEDNRNYRVSSNKVEDVLGFTPKHSIDDGIEDIHELVRSCRLRDVDNVRYTNQQFLSLYKTHVRSEVPTSIGLTAPAAEEKMSLSP